MAYIKVRKDDNVTQIILKKSSTVPFGYQTSEVNGYLKPIPEQLKN